jgi:HD superfamily phosphodiesterase
MSSDKSGHGIDHIDRVYNMAMRFCDTEGGNLEIIARAAMLHDAADYKLFGEQSSKKLTNAGLKKFFISLLFNFLESVKIQFAIQKQKEQLWQSER